MIRKIVIALVAVAFMTLPAFADNRPEFDAVGCDTANVFNGIAEELVIAAAMDADGHLLETSSDFDAESFDSNATSAVEDKCFEGLNPPYKSRMTPRRTARWYKWVIVLQMDPESDIDLGIRNCVMKIQGTDIMTEAQQTGRYLKPNGKPVFVKSANPKLTVRALPGPNAVAGWYGHHNEHGYKGFIMTARTLPGLKKVDLHEAPYTSKALWEEDIVMVMPKEGKRDREKNVTHQLVAGDIIKVLIEIPGNNPTRIRYGADNVMVRFIGIVDTELLGLACK
jgi:hypothetical protein